MRLFPWKGRALPFLIIASFFSLSVNAISLSTAKLVCKDVSGFIGSSCRLKDERSGRWIIGEQLSDVLNDEAESITITADRCVNDPELEFQIVVDRRQGSGYCGVISNKKNFEGSSEIFSMWGVLDGEEYSFGMDSIEKLLAGEKSKVVIRRPATDQAAGKREN